MLFIAQSCNKRLSYACIIAFIASFFAFVPVIVPSIIMYAAIKFPVNHFLLIATTTIIWPLTQLLSQNSDSQSVQLLPFLWYLFILKIIGYAVMVTAAKVFIQMRRLDLTLFTVLIFAFLLSATLSLVLDIDSIDTIKAYLAQLLERNPTMANNINVISKSFDTFILY